jgi:hypothetical protein
LKRFADWKCNVRKKARKLALSQVKTGGGPPDTPLTNAENRLLDLTGEAVVNGLENIPEPAALVEPPAAPVEPPAAPVEPPAPLVESPAPRVEPPAPPVKLPTPCPATRLTQKINNNKPLSHKQKQTKTTLAASVQNLVANDATTINLLQQINENLQALVNIKEKEVRILELKLKLKYPEAEIQLDDAQ